MLSKEAFMNGLAISTGAMTAHDLIKTLGFTNLPLQQRQDQLRAGLAELCRLELLTWVFESDYGNAPPETPPDFSERTFLDYWQRYLMQADFTAVPEKGNPTLFLEARPELITQISNPTYDKWKREIGWLSGQ